MKSLLYFAVIVLSVGEACGQAGGDKFRDISPSIEPASNPSLALEEISAGFLERANIYKAIKSMRFKATIINTPSEPKYTLTHGHLRFLGSGEKYLYEYVPVNAIQTPDLFSRVSAFDGIRTQTLTKTNMYLGLKRGLATDGNNLYLTNPFLMPDNYLIYSFAPSGYVIRLVDVANSQKWEQVLKTATLAGRATVSGAKCFAIDVPAGKELLTGLDCTARIYLDVDQGCFPIGWDLKSSNGHILFRYRVTKTASIPLNSANASMRYAQASTLNIYINKATPVDQFTVSWGFTIDEIGLNPEISDDEFTIDPSTADNIYDADAKKLITVPH